MFGWAVAVGILVTVLIIGANIVVMNKTGKMPQREASQYIVTRYLIRVAVITVVLGALTWFAGWNFSLGILAGMALGYFIVLLVTAVAKGRLRARLCH